MINTFLVFVDVTLFVIVKCVFVYILLALSEDEDLTHNLVKRKALKSQSI